MNNEEYQKKLEKCSKKKFIDKKNKHFYQGDKISPVLFSLVKKYVQGKILDIGAGTGALVKYLRSKNYSDVFGIDLYPKVNFIQKGIITNLKFKDNEFNTIFCTEVIEHLTNEQIVKGLSEIKRILKFKGHLIITVPYNENLENNSFICPKCGHKFHNVGHLQSFDKKRLSKILIKANFKIKNVKILPLAFMYKLPFSTFYWKFLMLFDKRFDYYKTLLIIAKK